MRGKGVATGGLAGFGTAELKHMPSGRGAPKVVIEGNDAVDLGAGNVQLLGDHRLGGLVDVAKFLLQGVKNRQQGTFAIETFANAAKRNLLIPRSVALTVSSWLHGR